MKKFLNNIKKYRKYAIYSAKAELKSEVADSYLNWLWWIIEPICFMLIYYFVFGTVFGSKLNYFISFIFIGLTMWDFFNRMITGSVRLIIGNRDLVTKVYVPKYILLISKSLTYLFKMGISLIICFILMIFQHVPFSFYFFLFIPIIIIFYIFTFGVCLLLMHFGVTLNDLGNLTRIGLRMIFYLSGVFYDIHVKLKKHASLVLPLLYCNPVAFIIYQMREVMLYQRCPNFIGLGIWFAIGLLLCILGVRLIHKNENSYAKVI